MFIPCQTMTAYAWKTRKLDTNVCRPPKARRGCCFQQDRPGGVGWHAQKSASGNAVQVHGQMSLSSYCTHRPCLTAGGVGTLWGGRRLRGELRQITTILLLLCTAAAFRGHSYGEQITLVITWAVLWSLEMCCCAHPGGILPRFPWCHGSTWSRFSSLVHTTAMGEKHITSELPAFRQYRVTVLSWIPGSSSSVWCVPKKPRNHDFGVALKAPASRCNVVCMAGWTGHQTCALTASLPSFPLLGSPAAATGATDTNVPQSFCLDLSWWIASLKERSRYYANVLGLKNP